MINTTADKHSGIRTWVLSYCNQVCCNYTTVICMLCNGSYFNNSFKTDLPYLKVHRQPGSLSFVNSAALEAILSSRFLAFHYATYGSKIMQTKNIFTIFPLHKIGNNKRRDTPVRTDFNSTLFGTSLKKNISTQCPRKNVLFIFWITLSKNWPLLIIFGMLNTEKIWHEHPTDLSTHLSNVASLPWEIQKSHFFNIMIQILQIIYHSSEEND